MLVRIQRSGSPVHALESRLATKRMRALVVLLGAAVIASGCLHDQEEGVKQALEVTRDDRFPDKLGKIPCVVGNPGPAPRPIRGTCETEVEERGENIVVRHISRWAWGDFHFAGTAKRPQRYIEVHVVSREGEIVGRRYYGDRPPDSAR